MGFISFEELMGKIAQVQNKLEKEKAEKEALGIFEADENTEDKKGVEIGIDAINKQRLVIRNNTLCFDPLTPEEQKNVNKRSDSLYCCVKGLQGNENTQTYGTASEVRSGKIYGKASSSGKAYGKESGYGKSSGNASGYEKAYGNASGYEKAYGNGAEVRNEQPIGPTHRNSDVIKNAQTVENVNENGNQCGTTASSVTEKFAEFWEAYPKKYNVDQARRTFLNLNPDDELHKKILSAISNAKKSYSWKNQNGRFIPFPAKWLRNHCWEEFKYDFYG